ncbi:MAG: cob(I)yrinic acid a,c-diamide adenosyltransferase [Pseudomonadota bacterium]
MNPKTPTQAPAKESAFGSADPVRHTEKMKKKKAARDRMMVAKTAEKGLLIVHTGAGKGKSSAAFGMALRCIGHGMKVGVVQFVKGMWQTGERTVFERFPDLCVFKALGEGFTWETQDKERDIAAARRALAAARALLVDPAFRMVILDEINIALRYGYLSLDEVLEAVRARPALTHAVLTGRGAPEALIEVADLVTEMTLVKHPFRAGIKAQKGVEF